MSVTQRSDLILPDVLAEEFSKGIAGMEVFNGSGVFTVNPGLQAGIREVGNDITVPYFESIGKAHQIAAGAALTPKKLEMSDETGTVIHIGDAVSISGWAQRAKATGRSLYDVAREQLVAGFHAKLEDLMVDSLIACAVAESMVYDGSAANFSITDIVETQKLFADELAARGGIRMWAMQSKPYWDAAQLADSTGRPLLTAVAGEELMRVGGKPVMMSDRDTLLVDGTSPQQYYSVAAKANAGAVWYNGNITIEGDRDALADNDLLIYHVYLVVHTYVTMPGGTKPGVAAAKSL
jgi:hypothetical protein